MVLSMVEETHKSILLCPSSYLWLCDLRHGFSPHDLAVSSWCCRGECRPIWAIFHIYHPSNRILSKGADKTGCWNSGSNFTNTFPNRLFAVVGKWFKIFLSSQAMLYLVLFIYCHQNINFVWPGKVPIPELYAKNWSKWAIWNQKSTR